MKKSTNFPQKTMNSPRMTPNSPHKQTNYPRKQPYSSPYSPTIYKHKKRKNYTKKYMIIMYQMGKKYI
jgi:hypothetical protein